MTYKPSQARYSGGGKIKYLVYRSSPPLRRGRTQERTRVKRMYFPANAREIVMEQQALSKGELERLSMESLSTTGHGCRRQHGAPEKPTGYPSAGLSGPISLSYHAASPEYASPTTLPKAHAWQSDSERSV
jgi:hypothetical protein